MTTTALPSSAAAVRPTTTPASRINPDTRLVLAGLLLVLVAVAASSFTLSFTGVSAAAPWAATPAELAWLVPVALEVAMLAYVVTAAVRTHRGQRARLAWTLVWALTSVSSAINALHAWDAGPQGWQGIVGAGLAAMFPFMTLAAAHVVVGVAFAPRPHSEPSETVDSTTDTEPAKRVDTMTDTASAGQAETAAAPAPRVVDTSTTDSGTDSGHQHDGRTARAVTRTARRTSGRVAAHHDEIVRLALTTDMSGREIATALGLGRTAVCARVSAARARTDVTRVNFGQGAFDVVTDAVGSPA
ncbi:DUF2637 domain-containing protein [Cellulosimicrobium cellulans]|uniref:DUF2637 domain-containing protein n=1 Tax=Cellulosimicrobium cellulans TaxID=1710 RepID=UPI00380A6176